MIVENIVRTFHPVGQGAFYSERFFVKGQPKAQFNVVYDCGTGYGYVTKSQQVVSQSFTKDDVIDHLFLSHLDYDHISLVKYLMQNVRRVHNIVMPFMYDDDIIFMITMMKISNHTNTASFLQGLLDHLHGENSEDDFNLLQVVDSDYIYNEDYHRGNNSIWKNGATKTTDIDPDWILIPYNTRQTIGKDIFINNLDSLLRDALFVEELNRVGYSSINSGEKLYGELKNKTFASTILNNSVLKDGIKNAYNKVEGGINDNSLLLYSGPASLDHGYRYVRCAWNNIFRFYRLDVGCLYTGDNDCNLSNWKNSFNSIWDNIGTIQLPHHGSIKSFNFLNNPIDKCYIFPVSCGSVNRNGHPSDKVLAYLLANNCYTYIVTELVNTAYRQVIRRQ